MDLKQAKSKIGPVLKISGFVLLGLVFISIVYLSFPYPNVSFENEKFGIVSSQMCVRVKLFGKNFSFDYKKKYPLAESKEIRLKPAQGGYEGNLDSDREIIRKRLSKLNEDLFTVETNPAADEIIVRTSTDVETNEVSGLASSQGKLSIWTGGGQQGAPALEGSQLDLSAIPIETGVSNEHVDSVATAYTQYGEAVEIKFKDPALAAELVPAGDFSTASIKLDGMEIGTMQQGTILEVNGENPVLASTSGNWEIKTIKAYPLYMSAEEAAALLKYGPLSSSFSLSEEREIPGQAWKTEAVFFVAAAAAAATILILFISKQTSWIPLYAVTLGLTAILASFIVKVAEIPVGFLAYFLTGLPIAIYSKHIIEVSAKTKQKIQDEIAPPTAMISAWSDLLDKFLWTAGVLTAAGFIAEPLRLLGVVSGILFILALLAKKLYLLKALKKNAKPQK